MGAEERGQRVDALFAFRRERKLACIAWSAFFRGVALAPGGDGAIRCRVAGVPTALVRVDGELHLDVATLAALWPRAMGELVARVGESDARALVSESVLIEPLGPGGADRLTELVLDHAIRAEDFHVLGADPGARAVPTLESEPRFELRFPAGTLELAYAPAAYADLTAADVDDLLARVEVAAEVRWNGAPITLPRSSELGWSEVELVELLVAASALVPERPGRVARLFAALLGPDPRALGDRVVIGSLLNLWGVALRNEGELEHAIDVLERALELARESDAQLEQQVRYNLGYAKLQTTMKTRTRVGGREDAGLYTASYDIDERHRATWRQCRAHFERALALDPSDATARSQLAQTETLLGLLDGNARGGGAAAPSPSARRERRDGTAPPAENRVRVADWAIPVVVVALAIAFLLSLGRSRDETPREVAASVPPPAPAAASARDLGEEHRIAALARLDASALPTGSDAPCPVALALPREVPPGEVVAPRLGRAIGTGELFGTEHFDATIRAYAWIYAPGVEVRPARSGGVGPVLGEGVTGPSGLAPRGYPLTLLVTDWRDPIVVEDGAAIVPGAIAGHLLVWSADDDRFVCAAEVRAENRAQLTITRAHPSDPFAREDDPLNRARLDLIESALREGIPRLGAIAQ